MKKYVAAFTAALAFAASPGFVHAAPAAAVPDPAVTAAVRDLLDTMHYRDVLNGSLAQLKQTMPDMMRAMVAQRVETDSRLTPVQKQQAMARAEQQIPRAIDQMTRILSDPKLVDQLMAEIVPLYAKNFTLPEIREIQAFYRSPTGQKVLVTLPKLMNDSMAISNKIIGPRMEQELQQFVEPAVKP
jgi:hypothetical protein